jgi:NAD(P)-dependent dehydrogenase (short-subunit alcohol dehydrogenase family)
MMNVDLRGVFFHSQATARKMIEKGRGGIIIDVISTDAFEINNGTANYSEAYRGVVMVTKTMAKETAPYQILGNGKEPGIPFPPSLKFPTRGKALAHFFNF